MRAARAKLSLTVEEVVMRVGLRSAVTALLAALLVAAVVGCGSDGSSSAEEASRVPDGHAAIALHSFTSVAQLSAAAQDSGVDFVCGEGDGWSACMINDEGVVGVVAFDPRDDMSFVMSGGGISGQIMVPVDEADVYGAAAPPGQVTLSIKIGETVVGTVTFGA
jgi:hypothetical protein